MHTEEAVENERRGVDSGLNPMFGNWQHRFDFAPISYAAGGVKRAFFRKAIQAELNNKFFYTNEVRLEIVLYLDVQAVLETDETADVDNYAKAILDGLKGPSGILLDDTQVQALTISWIDAHRPDQTYFEVSIASSPDDFMLKPLEFYEMPDGLWYPHGRRMWSDGGQKDQSDRNHYAGLLILETMSKVKRNARHLLRKSGMDRLTAYQRGMYVSSSARGFHRSRIDEGFPMHPWRDWRAAYEAWRGEHVDEIRDIENGLVKVRDSYGKMTALLAGEIPAERGSHMPEDPEQPDRDGEPARRRPAARRTSRDE